MPNAVSTADIKDRIDGLLADLDERGGEVIVESQGKPRAVLISVDADEEVRALRERQRRNEADQLLDEQRRIEGFARLRRLQQEISARNQDLTDEEADEIADELSRAAIARLVERGEITFERDRT